MIYSNMKQRRCLLLVVLAAMLPILVYFLTAKFQVPKLDRRGQLLQDSASGKQLRYSINPNDGLYIDSLEKESTIAIQYDTERTTFRAKRLDKTTSTLKKRSTSPPAYWKTSSSKHSREITHIEFLKVHKAASTTVQNIFIRFGLKRNLSFVIPADQHYISVEKTYFSDIWPPLPKESRDIQNKSLSNQKRDGSYKHDILCNHMVFNRKKVSRLLHNDSVFIGIIREPFDQFVSAAIYYKVKLKYQYLKRLPVKTFITDLIRNPFQNEATTMAESMTYNSMSYDFGMDVGLSEAARNKSLEIFDELLNETANIFHLVMLFEKFDESLVLLKRYLNLSFQDIIYVRSNTFSLRKDTNLIVTTNITDDDMKTFRERNIFDYKLYAFFKERIERQMAKEKMFEEEVNHFKDIVYDVRGFCEENNNETQQIISNSDKNTTSKKEVEPKDMKSKRLKILFKTIDSTINNKEMTEKQMVELRKLDKSIKAGNIKWPLVDLITLIPRLFRDKGNKSDSDENSMKSNIVIRESKWNDEFTITSADCKLMNMEELSLYQKVKSQHIRLTVSRIFGENFSVFDAIKHVLTFY